MILATGTHFKSLDVPGESLLRGKGVSQSASCDAPLLRDKEVVVAGGGDSALQEALTLAEHCARVTIVHHGAELSGQAAYREQAAAQDRIELRPESQITEIIGEQAVTAVAVDKLAGGGQSEIECASAFIFVGLQPNTEFMEDKAVLDDLGHIVTDAEMRTTRPGLLAAGTVRSASPGRAAAASGDGTTAALTASRYLDAGVWPNAH